MFSSPNEYYTEEIVEKYSNSRSMRKIQEELTIKTLNLLSIEPPAKILDLGCGVGYSTSLVKDLGFEVIGIDINSFMVRKALEKGLNVILGDFRYLKEYFTKQSFDCVISISALQWVKKWSDMRKVAEGIFYVLKEQGKAGIQFYPFGELELRMFCRAFICSGFKCKTIIEDRKSKKRTIFILLEKK